VQRWLLNPPMRVLTYRGLLPHHAVLETTGRRTGRPRRTVVGIARQPHSVLWIVAEHGQRAGYVRNLDTQPNVRIHLDRQWQRGVARLVANDDIDTRLQHFTPPHINVIRRFGTELGRSASTSSHEGNPQFGARAFGRRCEVAGRDHSSLRTAQRSGKTGTDSVVRR
jgi:deazaflavin-dependent oxidoreductase (nitroreductase family)